MPEEATGSYPHGKSFACTDALTVAGLTVLERPDPVVVVVVAHQIGTQTVKCLITGHLLSMTPTTLGA